MAALLFLLFRLVKILLAKLSNLKGLQKLVNINSKKELLLNKLVTKYF